MLNIATQVFTLFSTPTEAIIIASQPNKVETSEKETIENWE